MKKIKFKDGNENLMVSVTDITEGLKPNPRRKLRDIFKPHSKNDIWTKVEEPLDVTVIVPYMKPSSVLQTVVDALRIQFVQPRLVKLHKSPEAYWELLQQTWSKGDEFFIVEQDIIVWPGAINEMRNCEELWCTLPSLCHGNIVAATFGCVKFSAQLIAENQDIWDKVAERSKVWFVQDSGFSKEMMAINKHPHVHFPAAIHLNEVQWPLEISKRDAWKKVVWQYMETTEDAHIDIQVDQIEEKPVM